MLRAPLCSQSFLPLRQNCTVGSTSMPSSSHRSATLSSSAWGAGVGAGRAGAAEWASAAKRGAAGTRRSARGGEAPACLLGLLLPRARQERRPHRTAGARTRPLPTHTQPPTPTPHTRKHAHLQREEQHVGALARGARERVLDVFARPQRRLAVALPVQLGLLLQPRHAHAIGLRLDDDQLAVRAFDLALEVGGVCYVDHALLDARGLAQLARALLLGRLVAEREACWGGGGGTREGRGR